MTPVLKTGNAQAFFGSNPKPDAKGGLSPALLLSCTWIVNPYYERTVWALRGEGDRSAGCTAPVKVKSGFIWV